MRVVRLLVAFLVLAAPLRAQTWVRLVPMPDTSGAALAASLETALLSSPSFVLKHDSGGRQLRVGLMSGGSGSCGEATISSYTLIITPTSNNVPLGDDLMSTSVYRVGSESATAANMLLKLSQAAEQFGLLLKRNAR